MAPNSCSSAKFFAKYRTYVLVLSDSIDSIHYRDSNLLFTNTIVCLFGIRIRHMMEYNMHVIDTCLSINMADDTSEIFDDEVSVSTKLN